MIFGLIVACEIAFWIVLAGGLAARYLLGRRRLGAVLLAGVPLIDLVLLVASAIDLRNGATAGWQHGLAAVYIGFSVVFGPSMVRWADARFAHRFAGGPPPPRPPKSGQAAVRYEWREFGKACITWVITCGLLFAVITAVDDPDRTGHLWGWIRSMTIMLGVWSIWPITATLWPGDDDGKEGPAGEPEREPARKAEPRPDNGSGS
ncbi:hypothetical protein [Actinomadura sp. GC306]|uniref:hypothetical protein n=1 Tax=Actinomadura sp. GC306 TaxID=2530367 RepID=UPI001A9D6284|nr:hypothetical protein [Actinomadura sp. GC306]